MLLFKLKSILLLKNYSLRTKVVAIAEALETLWDSSREGISIQIEVVKCCEV